MKISLDWLSDFVTFRVKNPEKIADALTRATGEVEEIEQQGALLEHCCVGKVISLTKHPNADKLSLCEVQTDKGVKRVVCGGTNLRVGMRVAFAHIGATVRSHEGELWSLTPAKIRGELSEGMICASEELDLSEKFPPRPEQGHRPITDFTDGNDDVGKDLRTFLGLTDTIFHIDNHAITHRPDLFSHIGIARECVALGIAKWKKTQNSELRTQSFPKDPLPFRMHVSDRKLMPRYCACAVAIDGLGKTPAWMLRRLQATGWRPVNLPVDITNYVMMEIGVPLHSFDLGDIKGDVTMNATGKDEWITTLDGVERKLPAGAIVLRDDLGIFDLLGIMGGFRSSTKDTTRMLYVHSASLDPKSIRRTVIATGHRTDAATVYEKGVPHVITEQGFFRTLELLLELIPGARIASRLESFGDNGKAKPIALSGERLKSMLGIEIPEKKVVKIFTDLGFSVRNQPFEALKGPQALNGKPETRNQKRYAVTPPLWRLGDIHGEHDLIEEVGRIAGYDAIPPALPQASISLPPRDPRRHAIRQALKEAGCFEVVPLSFLGPSLLTKCRLPAEPCTAVENPLGEEFSLLQPSTLPGLLEHAERNLLQSEDTLATFSLSRVFRDGKEWEELGLLVSTKGNADIRGEPFLLAKAALTEALSAAGFPLECSPSPHAPPYAHPGRCAMLHVLGKHAGTLSELLPDISRAFDIPGRAVHAVVCIEELLASPSAPVIAKPLPAFPAITYDITLTVHHTQRTDELLGKIKAQSPLLESVEVADLWSGASLKQHQFNLTLRCTYRAHDRTLTETEVRPVHEKITAALSRM